MSNIIKKRGQVETLRKGAISRPRQMANQYPPVNVVPWDPYYPQYPPQDQQYILQDPQYIIQDPQYILQQPQYILQAPNTEKQSELNAANLQPYPYLSHFPSQDGYPPMVYTYATEPPNMAWGEGPRSIYGDWRQIPQNITKIEPIEIVELDENEPVMVLETVKNLSAVTNIKSSVNTVVNLNGIKQVKNAGPPKMDILKLAMNTTKVDENDDLFVDEIDNPSHSLESSDDNSMEQLEHNLASVENSLKYLESNLVTKVNEPSGTKSPQTVIDIVDSLNNRLENPKGPLENKMETVLTNLFSEDNSKDSSKGSGIPQNIVYNQWVFDDSDIPTGWFTRSYKVIVNGKSSIEHQFMAPDQTLFTSLSSLIEFMKTDGKFSREIMENLIVSKSGSVEIEQTLMNSLNSESSENNQQNSANNISRFKKPSGDFIFDETLPPGWKKRAVEVNSSQHRSGKVTRYYYYSQNNQKFISKTAVVQHMRQSGNYSDEQIVKVLSGDGRTGKRPASVEKTLNAPLGAGSLPSEMENSTKKIKLDKIDELAKTPVEALFSDWTSDSSLPTGWKIRNRTLGYGSTDYQYLSPDIKLFKSRSDVNEYLKTFSSHKNNQLKNTVENERTRQSIIKHTNKDESIDDEVSDLEKLLMEAANTVKKTNPRGPKIPEKDWELDDSLPEGWKKRTIQRKFRSIDGDKFVTQYNYMSPSGQRFNSRAQVVSHMEQSEEYTKEQVMAVEKGKQKTGARTPVINFIKTIDKTQTKMAKYIKTIEETQNEIAKYAKNETKDNDKITEEIKVETQAKISKGIKVESPNTIVKRGKKSLIQRVPIVIDKAPVKIAKDIPKPLPTKIDLEKFIVNQRKNKITVDGWETDDDMLPEGWAKRAYPNNNKEKLYQYCNNIHNPRNIFQSKIEAFRFMKNSKRHSLDEAFKFLIGVEKQINPTFSVSQENKFDFACNYCPLQFLTPKEQMNHQEQEHSGQFRFKCNECGTVDLKKTSLMYHVQSKHKGGQKGGKVTFNFEIPAKKEEFVQNMNPQPQQKHTAKPIAKYDKTVFYSKNALSIEEHSIKIKTPIENITYNNKYSVNSNNTSEEQISINNVKPKVEELNASEITFESKKSDHLLLTSNKEALGKIEHIPEANTEDVDSDEEMETDSDGENDETEMPSLEVENESGKEESSSKNCETEGVQEESSAEIDDNFSDLIENESGQEESSKEIDDNLSDLDENESEQEESSVENYDNLSDLDDFDSQLADLEENIEALTALTSTSNSTQNAIIPIPIGPEVTIRMDNFEILSLLFLATPNPMDTMIEDLSEGNNMSIADIEWTFSKLRNKFRKEGGEEVDREAVQDMVNQLKELYESDDYFEI